MKWYLTHALLISVAFVLASPFYDFTSRPELHDSDIPDLAVSQGEVRGVTFPGLPTELPTVHTEEAQRGYEKLLTTLRMWRDQLMTVLRDIQLERSTH